MTDPTQPTERYQRLEAAFNKEVEEFVSLIRKIPSDDKNLRVLLINQRKNLGFRLGRRHWEYLMYPYTCEHLYKRIQYLRYQPLLPADGRVFVYIDGGDQIKLSLEEFRNIVALLAMVSGTRPPAQPPQPDPTQTTQPDPMEPTGFFSYLFSRNTT